MVMRMLKKLRAILAMIQLNKIATRSSLKELTNRFKRVSKNLLTARGLTSKDILHKMEILRDLMKQPLIKVGTLS